MIEYLYLFMDTKSYFSFHLKKLFLDLFILVDSYFYCVWHYTKIHVGCCVSVFCLIKVLDHMTLFFSQLHHAFKRNNLSLTQAKTFLSDFEEKFPKFLKKMVSLCISARLSFSFWKSHKETSFIKWNEKVL